MAPKIKTKDMKTTVYRFGSIQEADGKPSLYGNEPGVRFSNSPKANGVVARPTGEVDKHFKQDKYLLSFSLRQESDKISKLLDFGPAGDKSSKLLGFGTAADKIIYLPYTENCITSTVIPTDDKSVGYFFTDAMSGCSFFIDERENGDLVCYHANAKQFSPTEEQVKANPAAFSQDAENKMDDLHENARKSEYPDAKFKKKLSAKDYYGEAQTAMDRESSKNRTGVEFWGGTTIMGFRVDKQWEFVYQTYGRLPCKDVSTKDAPFEIIHTETFWKSGSSAGPKSGPSSR